MSSAEGVHNGGALSLTRLPSARSQGPGSRIPSPPVSPGGSMPMTFGNVPAPTPLWSTANSPLVTGAFDAARGLRRVSSGSNSSLNALNRQVMPQPAQRPEGSMRASMTSIPSSVGRPSTPPLQSPVKNEGGSMPQPWHLPAGEGRTVAWPAEAAGSTVAGLHADTSPSTSTSGKSNISVSVRLRPLRCVATRLPTLG